MKTKRKIKWTPETIIKFKVKSRRAIDRHVDEHEAGFVDEMYKYCGKTITGTVSDERFVRHDGWNFSSDMAEKSEVISRLKHHTFDLEDEENSWSCRVYSDGSVRVGCTRLKSEFVYQILGELEKITKKGKKR